MSTPLRLTRVAARLPAELNLQAAFVAKALNRFPPHGMSRTRAKDHIKAGRIIPISKGLNTDIYCTTSKFLYNFEPKVHKFDLHTPYELVYKPNGLPTVSLDCLDLNSLEAVLARQRQAIIVNEDQTIKWDTTMALSIPEEGLLHRLDNDAEGWIARALTAEAYENYLAARSNLNVTSFYQVDVDSNDRTKSMWAQIIRSVLDPASSKDDAHLMYTIPLPKSSSKVVHKVPEIIEVYRIPDYLYVAVASGFFSSGPKSKIESLAFATSMHVSVFRIQWKQLTSMFVANNNNQSVQIEAQIKRGARHQLRAHLAAMGTPLIGDTIYGSSSKDGDHEDCKLFLKCVGYDAILSSKLRHQLFSNVDQDYWSVPTHITEVIDNRIKQFNRHRKGVEDYEKRRERYLEKRKNKTENTDIDNVDYN